MPAATYEFASFSAMADQAPRQREGRALAGDRPWVPDGRGGSQSHHVRSKGLPSGQERVAAAVEAVRVETAAEKQLISSRLDLADEAFQGLESRLDGLASAFEAHVTSEAAAAVLINTKLRQLGLLNE